MQDDRWIKTVGAPTPGDPRDGELHQVFGNLGAHFDLEPWDGETGSVARYLKAEQPPSIDGEGREVWLYVYDRLV